MRKLILAVSVFLLSACGTMSVHAPVLGSNPEAQIVNGNNIVNAGVATTTIVSRRNGISLPTAESYRAIFKTAANHIADANKRLVACRAKTGSTPTTKPDPCVASVGDDIELGVKMATDAKAVLDKK